MRHYYDLTLSLTHTLDRTQTTSEVDEDAESIEDIVCSLLRPEYGVTHISGPQPFPPLDPAYGKWILKDYVWDEQWEEADVEFKQVGWKHYEQLLVKRGYKLHLMPKDGAATESMPVIQPPILAPTEDPFHSKDNEILCFAINGRPVGGREFVQPVTFYSPAKGRPDRIDGRLHSYRDPISFPRTMSLNAKWC
jgi:hypothetical protein